MSKDNMEELQRYRIVGSGFVEDREGLLVRFSDVEEREARLKAHVKEARKVAAKEAAARIRADRNADARWRERIDGKCYEYTQEAINLDCGSIEAKSNDVDRAVLLAKEASVARSKARLLRSLLDSGEEQGCPDCEGRGVSSGMTWDGINPESAGMVEYPCPTCRASSSSPALEGREDERLVPEMGRSWEAGLSPDRDNEGGEDAEWLFATRIDNCEDIFPLSRVLDTEEKAREWMDKYAPRETLMKRKLGPWVEARLPPSNLSQETDNE